MIVRHLDELTGSDREVEGPGWKSRRLLLASDGMGYSLNDTIILNGASLTLEYKHHFEACYCIDGEGEIIDGLKCEQVFELSDASAERSAAGCAVKVGEDKALSALHVCTSPLSSINPDGSGGGCSIPASLSQPPSLRYYHFYR